MEILILILLTLVNGIFSMSEIAVVSARRFKLENAARKGNRGASKAIELAESPGRFLSTVQIGITLTGILLGLYSGETLTGPVRAIIEQVPALQPYAPNLALVLVLLFTTFLSIVLGELFPKRIGMSFPDAIAAIVSRPMYWLSRLAAPFVWLLTRTNDLLLRLFNINASTDSIVTEEEIKSMVSESAESGEIAEIEQDIVERVFALGDRKVGALMTHRNDLIWLDAAATPAEIREAIGEELHNMYPVADGELEEILGFVSVKDLFLKMDLPGFALRDHLRASIFTPVSTSAYKLMEEFRQKRFHYALAVDEFGSIQGMVTMNDLMDALVGDVTNDEQSEYQLVQKSPDYWLADGQYPFFEFLHLFELDKETFATADFTTIGGFVIHRMGAMPKKGDAIDWSGFHFEVLTMEGRRIAQVGVKKI